MDSQAPMATTNPPVSTTSTDATALMSIISKMTNEQKIQFWKLLQMNNIQPDSLSQMPIDIQNNIALQQLAQKYGMTQNPMMGNYGMPQNPMMGQMMGNYCMTQNPADVQQIKNQLNTIQYELIDIVRHMKEYTNKYVDMVQAKTQDIMKEY